MTKDVLSTRINVIQALFVIMASTFVIHSSFELRASSFPGYAGFVILRRRAATSAQFKLASVLPCGGIDSTCGIRQDLWHQAVGSIRRVSAIVPLPWAVHQPGVQTAHPIQ